MSTSLIAVVYEDDAVANSKVLEDLGIAEVAVASDGDKAIESEFSTLKENHYYFSDEPRTFVFPAGTPGDRLGYVVKGDDLPAAVYTETKQKIKFTVQPGTGYTFNPSFDTKGDVGTSIKFIAKRQQPAELVTELCKQFYTLGWVTGTGGSICMRFGERIFMAPSGVQKERMLPDDIFRLDSEGGILERRNHETSKKLSQCFPLFMSVFNMRGARACIHSHSVSTFLVTLKYGNEFRCRYLEMIKGITGHEYYDELVVPIIENTAHECDLADSLQDAIRRYPKTYAVLVRRHGIYVWGPTWEKAKSHAECYHYLFEAALKMMELGISPTAPPQIGDGATNGLANGHSEGSETSNKRAKPSLPLKPYKAVLLDIEGTTTPISFVHDVLFPYAKKQVRQHLEDTWDSKETQGDVEALRELAQQDVESKAENAVPIVGEDKATIIDSVVKNVEWQMGNDRKSTALKALQGHIWRTGYAKGLLKGTVYEDVVDALKQWQRRGIKVYIYSSGSRNAQTLLFGNTHQGDLRPYLSGFFDTTSGAKTETSSYTNIRQTIGVEPEEIVFVTDMLGEATAAEAAGLQVVLSKRPGNKPLDPTSIPVVESFSPLV